MSPVDSGEYVCRVVGGSVPLEASVLVTIEPIGTVPGKGAGVEEQKSLPPLTRPSSSHSSQGLTLSAFYPQHSG